jgi:beta-glucuronidase
MLYPQSNSFRQVFDLSCFWDFAVDPENSGMEHGWPRGFDCGHPIAVPASWNDQFDNLRDYLGAAWYMTSFDLPWGFSGNRVVLRFGSVNYLAEVWVNGAHAGGHEGGHLPFELDVTPHLRAEKNILVVRVEGELAPDRVPPGNIPPEFVNGAVCSSYPATAFDFFPFCGIHRPVLLHAVPINGMTDIMVATDAGRRTVRVSLEAEGAEAYRIGLKGFGADMSAESKGSRIELIVPDALPWSPETPHLYDLTVEPLRDGKAYDRYTLRIGIRTIEADGDALLLNGKPVMLKGFGRHEDFPVTGRGLVPAVIIKDYALMKWVGANSFRTTHYPYSEQMMDMADRLGFLVIDETPAVGLFFHNEGLDRRLVLCRQYVRELIARDKNHPSVIMWSLANEPGSSVPAAKPFFRDLYDLAKSIDPGRPVTVVSCIGAAEESFEFLDVVCLNRYIGWYTHAGRLDEASALLSKELDALHHKYPKPLILSEFGADAVTGAHAIEPEMFSEEYQAEMIARYIKVANSKPFVAGQHVWNLCDFKTGQGVWRVGAMNLKGIFTRDRRPKLAAYRLRELWGKAGL